jgi:hypothetical protein
VEQAVSLLPELKAKVRTPSNGHLVRHTEARVALAKKEYDQSREILKREIAQYRNVEPNLGLLVRVELAAFDDSYGEFPAIAAANLKAAESALDRLIALDSSNDFIETLRGQIEDRKLTGRTKIQTGSSSRPGLPLPPRVSTIPSSSSSAFKSAPSLPTPTKANPTTKTAPSPYKKPLKPPLLLPGKPPFKG